MPRHVDAQIMGPGNRPMSSDEVRTIAHAIANAGGFRGVRIIGPGCVHCLCPIDDGSPVNYGLIVPQTEEFLNACGGHVLLYHLCTNCQAPDVDLIEQHAIGAMHHIAVAASSRAAT